jgi:transposase InsO family protein
VAIWQRKPPKGLIWHTDRGSQYASKAHRALLKTHKIQQSMSRKGDCWDNAVAESFFHTLKTELVYHERYQTREQARHSIFEYIEVFYLCPLGITAYVAIPPMARCHQRILKHIEKSLNFLS